MKRNYIIRIEFPNSKKKNIGITLRTSLANKIKESGIVYLFKYRKKCCNIELKVIIKHGYNVEESLQTLRTIQKTKDTKDSNFQIAKTGMISYHVSIPLAKIIDSSQIRKKEYWYENEYIRCSITIRLYPEEIEKMWTNHNIHTQLYSDGKVAKPTYICTNPKPYSGGGFSSK